VLVAQLAGKLHALTSAPEADGSRRMKRFEFETAVGLVTEPKAPAAVPMIYGSLESARREELKSEEFLRRGHAGDFYFERMF
jgi:hypothetical protein